MSIGKKFLSRVLNEAKEKDVDGFKDNFDITSIPSTSPAVANLTMPMARQIVQLYHLLGISLETLESRPKAVKSAALEVADEMRTNRPLRIAAQRLFAALATAKGFARQEVKEAEEAPVVDKITKKPMASDKEIDLIGSKIVRQIEEVLAALNFPSGLLTRAMRRDAASLMDTASLVQRGVVRSKFMMLADQLGVDLANVGSEVTVKEEEMNEAPAQGQKLSEFEMAAQQLLAALGVDVAKLPSTVKMKMKQIEMGDKAIGSQSSMLRLMNTLVAKLSKQGRAL